MFSGNWIPKTERSRSFAFFTIGGYVGSIITMPLSGYLCEYGNFFDLIVGWEVLFYVLGALALLAVSIWWIFVFDQPSKHPFITAEELTEIYSDLDLSKNIIEQSTISCQLDKNSKLNNNQLMIEKKPPKLGSNVPWITLLTSKGRMNFYF